MKNLPISLSEIGLVDCGISDIGGIEILKWMKNSPNLQMNCMEQNDFSDEIRNRHEFFKGDNPQVVVIYL